MKNASKMTVQVLECDAESLARPKDEEYAYWQSRRPLERLVAMLELSFAPFGITGNEAESRQRFLLSPRCLPCPWVAATKAQEQEPKA